MVQNNNPIEFDEFIINPTELSKHIIELANQAKRKYEELMYSKKLKDKIRLRLLYLNEYQNIYNFINAFDRTKLPNDIDSLFMELGKVFNYTALNNLLLAYAFLTEKNKINPIITKEDKRLLYLKKLCNKEISPKEFNEEFGHYALNAFELSSIRFSEYSKKELIEISKFLKDYQLNKKISIKKYIKIKKRSRFAIYSTLREELKYIALFMINDLRFSFIKIAKEKQIKDIFNVNYDDIKRKFYY